MVATPAPAEPPLIAGTAGHVDHGKTALVKALTGEDTDRLPEEKRRGISIDLGFASFRLPGGREVSLVDVPGHERFIRNMVAGAAGMDLVLLVVAADEGVMPQTREHLDILELLGVRSGAVVITKIDLVESEWLELVSDEVRAAVAGTFLDGAPVVPVSSVTGEGLEALRAVLERLAGAARPKDPRGPARLPVDRAFTVPGFGTVVTGTLYSGTVAVEDRLELLPARRAVRVRGVQVHGRRAERAAAGQRVALNLAGVEREEVRRGDVLVTPGALEPVSAFAARLRLLPGAPGPLRSGDRVHLHTGTAEVLARVLLLDREALAPGDACFVQVKAESPLAVGRGDRYIIRSYSPVVTVGGGAVLETARRFKRHHPGGLEALRVLEAGEPREIVAAALAEDRPLSVPEVARRAGLPPEETAGVLGELAAAGRAVLLSGGEYALGAEAYRILTARVSALLLDFHRRFPLRRGRPREEVRALWPALDVRASNALLERLEADGVVRLEQDVAALAGHRPSLTEADERALRALEAAYREAGLSPPAPADVAAALGIADPGEFLNRLLDTGVLVKAGEDLYFHRDALAAAAQAVRRHLEARGSMTMAEMRDLLGTTRKYAVPLGEYFDRIRLTRRTGDARRLA